MAIPPNKPTPKAPAGKPASNPMPKPAAKPAAPGPHRPTPGKPQQGDIKR